MLPGPILDRVFDYLSLVYHHLFQDPVIFGLEDFYTGSRLCQLLYYGDLHDER